MPRALLLACVVTLLASAAAARLPIEDFSHDEAFHDMALSPDGRVVAYDEAIKGEYRIYLRDIETGQKVGIDPGLPAQGWTQRTPFFWANNERFLYRTTGGFAALDRDGTDALRGIPGASLLHPFRDEDEGLLLMTGFDVAVGSGMRHVDLYYPRRPHVLKVNPRTGAKLREVENPGRMESWCVSPTGVVSIGVEIDGTRRRTVHRTVDGSWVVLPGLDWSDPANVPLGFSADGKTLYLARVTPGGTWGVYPYDVAERRLGEPMLANERFDILPGFDPALTNGFLQQTLIIGPKDRALLGIAYTTEFPRTLWLDQRMAQAQGAIDQALPQRINTVVSLSDDLQRIIVLSWTARDPGTFYLFDRAAGKLEKLVARMPWIDPAAMSDVRPVRFKARDGVMLQGYITFPAGREAKDLPVVALVRDRLWSRATWEFDRTAQFLANRGYAVLQVNQRGSSGYGEPFRVSGHHAFGGAMQHDLADGVRWMVGQKLADPARVGILGVGPFGGCAALLGLALEPELYRCGIASEPFTDWEKVIDRGHMDGDAYALFSERIGDPEKDPAVVRAASPLHLAAHIKAAVLLIHTSEDVGWIFNQSKAMVAALKKSGRDVEFETKYTQPDFGFESRAKWLGSIESFLLRNIPPER